MKYVLITTLFIMLFSCDSPTIRNIGDDVFSDQGQWIKYSGNPIIKPGIKGGGTLNDYYNSSDCFVVKESNQYKMWYTTSGFTATLSNNHCNISYATSSDGIIWIKYPGNPVLDVTLGGWDSYAVETVSILIDTTATPDKKYKMWYAGQTSQATYNFGYAYSSDGINWIKDMANPVLLKGDTNEWDNSFIEGPCVIKDGSVYKMWYAGMDAVPNSQPTDGKVCIGYATSPDGITWTKYASNPVMMAGLSGAWDYKTAQDPHVIKYKGIYYMWYGGKTTDVENYGQQTGFAYSMDGIIWTKSFNNPTFKRGIARQWDATTASYGCVLIDGNKVKIWYTGMDKDYDTTPPDTSMPTYWEIGYAERTIINGEIRE